MPLQWAFPCRWPVSADGRSSRLLARHASLFIPVTSPRSPYHPLPNFFFICRLQLGPMSVKYSIAKNGNVLCPLTQESLPEGLVTGSGRPQGVQEAGGDTQPPCPGAKPLEHSLPPSDPGLSLQIPGWGMASDCPDLGDMAPRCLSARQGRVCPGWGHGPGPASLCSPHWAMSAAWAVGAQPPLRKAADERLPGRGRSSNLCFLPRRMGTDLHP